MWRTARIGLDGSHLDLVREQDRGSLVAEVMCFVRWVASQGKDKVKGG
jgi:hypothetical protein